MCRSIHCLHNYDPAVTEPELRAAALQYVRKISGMNRPSRANDAAFTRAVDAVAAVSRLLLAELVATTPPRDREREVAAARRRAAARYPARADASSGT